MKDSVGHSATGASAGPDGDRGANSVPSIHPSHTAAIVEPHRARRHVSTATTTATSPDTMQSMQNEDDAVIAAPAPTSDPSPRQAAAQIPFDDASAKSPAVAIAATASTDVDTANGQVLNRDSNGGSTDNVVDRVQDNGDHNENRHGEQAHDDDFDESDYEYEDDDDAAYSGFIMESEHANALNTASTSGANIVEEDTVPSPSASTAAAAASSAATAATATDHPPASSSALSTTAPAESSPLASSNPSASTAAAAAGPANPPKRKWREPTRQAVNMSLRAQSESTGSKRRLAQDLYKIMNQDTHESGFRLSPQSEDSMERWKIQLFQFDPDSNLAKDMLVLGLEDIELEMSFPDQYPFEPPFVRVVRPRFKRQTGFVMNGALCMELLTKEGWNPVNDIESVIVSIRSLLVVGDGRLQAASEMSSAKYDLLLASAQKKASQSHNKPAGSDDGDNERDDDEEGTPSKRFKSAFSSSDSKARRPASQAQVGSYSASEAKSAYSHLSDYHKKRGWDNTGWWAKKG